MMKELPGIFKDILKTASHSCLEKILPNTPTGKDLFECLFCFHCSNYE
jgi:hypothetical protein